MSQSPETYSAAKTAAALGVDPHVIRYLFDRAGFAPPRLPQSWGGSLSITRAQVDHLRAAQAALTLWFRENPMPV